MSLQSEIMADGPIGYWRKFTSDIGGGTPGSLDQSGRGNHLATFVGPNGAPTDGTSLVPTDLTDPSFSFPAGSNLWTASARPDLNIGAGHTYGLVSISCIVKADLLDTNDRDIARKGDQYAFFVGGDGFLHARLNLGGQGIVNAVGTTALAEDTAYHVGMVWTASELQVYLNGVLDGSTATTGPYISTDDSAAFAIAAFSTATHAWSGQIDEVAIYGSVLTSSRFLAHYVAAFGAGPASLVPHYSGGAGNASGNLSKGGAQGNTLTAGANQLFDHPISDDVVAGFTDYRAIYLEAPEAATDVVAYFSALTTQTDTAEAIGTEASPAQTIATLRTAPTGVPFSSPTVIGSALSLGSLSAGSRVPLWIRRVVSADAAEGTRSFAILISWTTAESTTKTLTIPISYSVTKTATLYVNADHPNADDTRLRADAMNDPTLPFKTVHAAIWQLHAGDICQIEPAANANLADPNDVRVYDPFDTYNGTPPAADSSSSPTPTKVVGHIVSGQRPRLHHWTGANLQNWEFQDIQFGYDRGSGDDHDTMGVYSFCYDLKFTNCVWTGGTWWVRGFGGLLWLHQCQIYHPFTGQGFLSGVGMWVLEIEAGGIYPTRPGIFRVTSSHIEECPGEDGFQLSSFEPGSRIEIGCNLDTGEVLGNTFKDLPQTNESHTDATQIFGNSADVYIIGNYYVNCASPFIASDGIMGGRVIVAKNIFGEGCVWTAQFEGCENLWILNNTARTQWGFLVYERALVTQHIRIRNNIVPWIHIGATIDPTSVVDHNLTYEEPGSVTDWGTQLIGFPEFGTSDRTDGVLTDAYELANSGGTGAGIGAAGPLTGLGLNPNELALLTSDFFGRTYVGDIGALQSASGVPVTPAPRPPFVTAHNPTGTQVFDSADVTITLQPVSGRTIDETTVTDTSFYVLDPDGVKLPVVSRTAEGNTLTMNIENLLYALATYTVVLKAGVADSDGNATLQDFSWSFRVAGPYPLPAVRPGTEPSSAGSGFYRYDHNAIRGDGSTIVIFKSDIDGLMKTVRMGQTIYLSSADVAFLTQLGLVFVHVS